MAYYEKKHLYTGFDGRVIFAFDDRPSHTAVWRQRSLLIGQKVVRQTSEALLNQPVDDPFGLFLRLGVPGQELDHEIEAGSRALDLDTDAVAARLLSQGFNF